MSKKIVKTTQAAQAIGPYNQAVVCGNMVYTSGNISLSAEGHLVGEGNIQEQTVQVFKNLQAVLEAAGASLETVVKTTCFLKDMNDFASFNELYSNYFQSETAPARSTVEVARLPKDVLVEVEAIAYLK